MKGRACHAFTLVELLIVLTIIGVLASSAVVSLQGRGDIYALRVSSSDLAAAVRFASEQARGTRTPQRIVFSETRDSFRLEAWNLKEGAFVPAEGLAGMPHRLAGGVTFVSMQHVEGMAEQELGIASFGSGGSGFSGQIRIKNRLGEVAAIEVLAQSGQVHVLPSR